MKTVELACGISMPLIGLGTWDLRGRQCEDTVRLALEMGCRLVDTAQMYGNEAETGRGIRASGIPRREVFVTSKLFSPSRSHAKAKAGIRASLQALGLDWLDLMLIHEPYEEAEEMYAALEEARAGGLVRAIGVSNFGIGRLERLIARTGLVPAVNQVELHVLHQQPELVTRMRRLGVHAQAWSPLGCGRGGLLAIPALGEIARAHGRTPAQVALNFLTSQGISVIPKSSRPERLAENLACADFTLSGDEMARLRGLDQGASLFGWY
ncbi:MAG: aldo/keto reductase [Desulfovibrionaceae bacterium]|nr:aldo/keto reductase [Desulfovibrionaceae bacterium]